MTCLCDRPPSAVFDRGHAVSVDIPSESELSSEPSTSTAARLWRAGGLHSSMAAPPSLYVIAPIPDLCYGPRYAAIWHANAHQLTTPRGPRDEALRASATPTVGSEWRMTIGVGCGANT